MNSSESGGGGFDDADTEGGERKSPEENKDDGEERVTSWVDTKSESHDLLEKEKGLKRATQEVSEVDKNIERRGWREFYELRKKWSWFIAVWVSVLVAFNIILTILVGSKSLDFTDYQWFVTAVTVETFLQVVGLGYVAVNSLFSDRSRDRMRP